MTNQTEKARVITEIRGLVFDTGGTMIERRLVWQDSLKAIRPDSDVPARGTAIFCNPMPFNHASPGRRMRFEFDLDGIDLVVIDREGRLWRGDGKRTSDWLGWGQPVRAAAAGAVASIHDGQADNVVIGSVDKWGGPKKSDPMSSYGNYVLIDHGRGEFTLYGHMRQGSVQMKQGQRVAAGTTIGKIGNSGASGGVHLHWERRRGRGFGLAGIETQPAYVHDVEMVGSKVRSLPMRLAIDTGDVLLAQ